MRTAIEDLSTELQTRVAWQRVPSTISSSEYLNMVIWGVKRLYIDTGRASSYSDDIYTTEESKTYITLDAIDEEEYILLAAELSFFQKVQTDVNNTVSYTTDALSVTNADKPYAHLQDTIANIVEDMRRIYYKMPRYTLDYVVDE